MPRNRNTFYLKKGDTPYIQSALTRGGDPENLTNATARFLMSADPDSSPLIAGNALILSALAGTVQYEFQAGETDTPGEYNAEWEVTFIDGRKVTYPDDSYNIIVITDDLD